MNQYPCCKHCDWGCPVEHLIPCTFGCNGAIECCKTCLLPVTMMVQKGTGYCSAKCQDEASA